MLNKSWRFIDCGLSSANYNMAVDEALLSNLKGEDEPILRIYGWENSLSLGRFSDAKKSINLKIAQEKEIPLVRRISGGGILVHGGDLSYSLILPQKHLDGIGVKESYHYLCGFIIRLYKKLGLDAGFSSELNIESSKSNICMAANEPYDIVIKGQKIGGNAQRYKSKFLLQHGSIPIGIDEKLFKDVFFEKFDLKNMLTLDKMDKSITYEQLSCMLKDAFEKEFKAKLRCDALNDSEQFLADKLLLQKYSQKRWNIDAKQDDSKAAVAP